METPGKNTVIAFDYMDQQHEIYFIPQDFNELTSEVKGKFVYSQVLFTDDGLHPTVLLLWQV